MLSILDIVSVAGGYKRPIREGEAHFQSGLLFGVGLINRKESVYECQGLAVQTSAASSKPHEINVKLDMAKEEGDRVLDISCSCIAGQSSKCKHAIATLLWLTRNEEGDLHDVSCTDVEQQWGKLKSSGKPDLEACTLRELRHVGEKQDDFKEDIPAISPEMREKWRDILLKCKSSSS